MQTILVLFGGCSTEYDVSLQSAHAVLQALDPGRFRALPVGITREGRWLRYQGAVSHLETGDWQTQPGCVPCALSPDRGSGGSCGWTGPAGERPSTGLSPSSTGRTGRTAPSRVCWSWRTSP